MLWFVAMVPLLWLLGLYALAVRGAVQLGSWPPEHPALDMANGWSAGVRADSLGIHTDILAGTFLLLAFPLPLIVPLFVGAALTAKHFRKRTPATAMVLVAGTALMTGQIVFDPFGVFAWLLAGLEWRDAGQGKHTPPRSQRVARGRSISGRERDNPRNLSPCRTRG